MTAIATVYMMILILYWAAIGFLSCVFGIVGMFALIRETFGRKAFLISLIISGLLVMKIGDNAKRQEIKVVEKFLMSWKSETDNNCQSITYITDWNTLVDWDRLGENKFLRDSYFANNIKLESYEPPTLSFVSDMDLAESVNGYLDAGTKKVKLIISNVVINSAEMTGGKSMPTTAKFWVAHDSQKIVKFTLY